MPTVVFNAIGPTPQITTVDSLLINRTGWEQWSVLGDASDRVGIYENALMAESKTASFSEIRRLRILQINPNRSVGLTIAAPSLGVGFVKIVLGVKQYEPNNLSGGYGYAASDEGGIIRIIKLNGSSTEDIATVDGRFKTGAVIEVNRYGDTINIYENRLKILSAVDSSYMNQSDYSGYAVGVSLGANSMGSPPVKAREFRAQSSSGSVTSVMANGSVSVYGKSSFLDARSATVGESISTGASNFPVGIENSGSWDIHRMHIPFDTSSIPNDSVITGATLFIHKGFSGYAHDLVVAASSATFPLDLTGYTAYGNTEFARTYKQEDNFMSLNSPGISHINRSGITAFCLLSTEDFSGVYTGAGGVLFGGIRQNQIVWGASFSDAMKPKLIVTYAYPIWYYNGQFGAEAMYGSTPVTEFIRT